MQPHGCSGWLVLIQRMAGMGSGPGGDPGALGWFAATRAVMTAAMMLPAAAPAVLGVVRARPSKAPAAALLFLAGYGAVDARRALWLLTRGGRLRPVSGRAGGGTGRR
jgi:predicted metal-binding membrane protein